MTAAASALSADLTAQGRSTFSGGGGSSTSRVASPTVVASWRTHDNWADGRSTTLLVLWRGTPGWFSKGDGRGGSGSGGGSSAQGSRSHGFEELWQGGLSFRMEFDDDARIVTMMNQELSLDSVNVVLVDFVDSANGATIVGTRWIEPAAAADKPAAVDAIASVVRRSPELFDYLRCDLTLPAESVMGRVMPMLCAQMRPQ